MYLKKNIFIVFLIIFPIKSFSANWKSLVFKKNEYRMKDPAESVKADDIVLISEDMTLYVSKNAASVYKEICFRLTLLAAGIGSYVIVCNVLIGS